MHPNVGDRLTIIGHRVGQPARHGEVLEVRGADGGPPYMVRWDDADHSTLFFPGSDCAVERATDATTRSESS